jgi:hypothetical protein
MEWLDAYLARRAAKRQRLITEHDYTVDVQSGCWNWNRATNSSGYGYFSIHGEVINAAKVMWEQIHECKMPEGLEPHHTCFNPKCINPLHVEPLTRLENMRRRRPNEA